MDSLMSDYPIGSLLVWKPPTKLGIRTRDFSKDYKSGYRPTSEASPLKESPFLVLDGQQRLQSLYLAFFGSYDGKFLYLKIDSDPDREQENLRYQFQFLDPKVVALDKHWILVRDVASIEIPKISRFVDEKFKEDPDHIKERIKENLGKFIQVFKVEERIYIQDVKRDLPYNDVLEVFVRVNSGGLILTKSDLVFSTIVLNIPEMEELFIDLVDQLNGSGEYDFDIDFIIKTSFVLFDMGAKYEVQKLKNDRYLKKLKGEFNSLQSSLFSTKEFLQTDAKVLAKRFLKSDLALIPIVDFIFQQPHKQLPEGQATRLRQYLYMSFFMRFYSHGPDGKLDVIHRKILNSGKDFPSVDIGKYMELRTGMKYEFHRGVMANDLDLALNIIQGGVAEIPKRRGWSLERDHIFPQKLLGEKEVAYLLAHSVGNFRLINKTRNILKSASLPAEDIEFLGSEDPEIKKLFLRTRKELTETHFKAFVQAREELMLGEISKFLGFS
jgi:hypothetical protein